MNNNDYAYQPVQGKHVTELMRRMNALEKEFIEEKPIITIREEVVPPKNIVIVIIASKYTLNKINITFDVFADRLFDVFSRAELDGLNFRVALIDEGKEPMQPVVLCQPTSDINVFKAAGTELRDVDLDDDFDYMRTRRAIILARDSIQWSWGNMRVINLLGCYWGGPQGYSEYYQDIALMLRGSYIISVTNQYLEHYLGSRLYAYEIYGPFQPFGISSAGGIYIREYYELAPLTLIIDVSFPVIQTVFYKYPQSGKISLGTPDGGVNIPALNALAGTPLTPDPILDLRYAIERFVAGGYLREPLFRIGIIITEEPFPFSFLFFFVNNLRKSKYGATTDKSTWTRSKADMLGTPPYDIDIGEVYEAIRLMESWVGAM